MAARSKDRPTIEQVEAAEEQIVQQSKRIDFFLTEYSVELLAQKIHDEEYVVPVYQREYTWEDRRKSRFIESLLMGLPIPFIFFWEMPDGRLEIVDGSQRLRTIEEFIHGDLELGELDPLTHLSGFRFSDLPASRQRKIKNRSVRGIVLNEHADEAARFDMFERINTGSKIANHAEIRRGALAGPFLDVVSELANSPLLIQLAPMQLKAKKERGYEELVTRLFAYGDGLETYRDRPSDFLFSYSKKMNEAFAADPTLADKYRQRFFAVLEFISQNFPFGFRKTEKSKATPRSRFEAIAIGVDGALAEQPKLADCSASEVGVTSWINEPEFLDITSSDGANAVARLHGRIDYVKNKLVERVGD
ncbi:DUF262 domain-containing protein [Ferrimicrobium sp.]|uniref:DUF262 domain-containing protein n=1 Tax=Ferrimicrobium sp. TaxID=2926050 RepID=UPI00262D16E3|nr:DUF262 domain-containing protein [Ferrimicrobium sp.]